MLSKVTMILRGYNYEQVSLVAKVLTSAKYVKNIEITLNTENAYEIIKKISNEYKGNLNVGAGTVQNLQQLKLAINAGATFALSPHMMSKEMIAYANVHNVIAVPGVFTPSEIYETISKGAKICKVFPANELSINYANKIIEPMGDINLMAVGGVTTNNVKAHFDGGYNFVGSAAGIFNKQDIIELNETNLRKSLIEFESKLD